MGVFNEKLCKLCLQLLSFLNYLGETKKGGCKFPPSQTNGKRKNAVFPFEWSIYFILQEKELRHQAKWVLVLKKGKYFHLVRKGFIAIWWLIFACLFNLLWQENNDNYNWQRTKYVLSTQDLYFKWITYSHRSWVAKVFESLPKI